MVWNVSWSILFLSAFFCRTSSLSLRVSHTGHLQHPRNWYGWHGEPARGSREWLIQQRQSWWRYWCRSAEESYCWWGYSTHPALEGEGLGRQEKVVVGHSQHSVHFWWRGQCLTMVRTWRGWVKYWMRLWHVLKPHCQTWAAEVAANKCMAYCAWYLSCWISNSELTSLPPPSWLSSLKSVLCLWVLFSPPTGSSSFSCLWST